MSEKLELSILASRRRALVEQRNEAIRVLNATDKELNEVDFAGRVVARLSGAVWPPESSPEPMATAALSNVASLRQVVPAAEVKPMTQPDMVISVMASAHADPKFDGISPVEIGEAMERRFKIKLPKAGISPIVWRLWQSGKLIKVRDGMYRLPQMKEATDLLSREDQPAASGSTPAQGGEARPGGGT